MRLKLAGADRLKGIGVIVPWRTRTFVHYSSAVIYPPTRRPSPLERKAPDEAFLRFFRLARFGAIMALALMAFGIVRPQIQWLTIGYWVVACVAAFGYIGLPILYVIRSFQAPLADLSPWVRRFARMIAYEFVLLGIVVFVWADHPSQNAVGIALALLGGLVLSRGGRLSVGELGAGWGPLGPTGEFGRPIGNLIWIPPEYDAIGAFLVLFGLLIYRLLSWLS